MGWIGRGELERGKEGLALKNDRMDLPMKTIVL